MQKVSLFALRTDFPQTLLAKPLPIAQERLTEISRISNGQARCRTLGGELLLCWAVRKLRPQGVPIPPVRSLMPQGKPYFAENPAFHFSLSHSGVWAVLAVSGTPVGVDIEYRGMPRPHIVRRYFHRDEKAFFFSLPEPVQTQAFYALWTLKESVVKALGTGMHLPFSSFAISLCNNPPSVTGLQTQTSLALPDFCDPAYQLAVCALSPRGLAVTTRVLTASDVL